MGFMAMYAPAARFTSVGQRIGGKILDARLIQTSDWKTRRPEFWQDKAKTYSPTAPDGTPNEPKAQLEVTVDTGRPDENGETERRLFIKNARQWKALRQAIKDARARAGLQLDGSIFMTWTGTEASDGPEDAKTWAIEYTAPAPGQGRDFDDQTVHLVGGGAWVKGEPATAPVAEPPAAAPARASSDFVPITASARPEIDPNDPAVQEAIARVLRAQASSPLAHSLGIADPTPARRVRDDEEPPF